MHRVATYLLLGLSLIVVSCEDQMRKEQRENTFLKPRCPRLLEPTAAALCYACVDILQRHNHAY